jgi:DNA-binding transcriptional LysR family regulator
MPDRKRTSNLDWEDIRYFVALARHGSLSATARSLRVNHATVARHVASLEALLGRALFERRADGYPLTAEGKAVLDEASAMDNAALGVLRRLDAGTELSGLVRLTAARALADGFLIDRLGGLRRRYPALDLELIADARIVSVARRDADLALRLGAPKDSDLVARRVGHIGFGLMLQPATAKGSRPGARRSSSAMMRTATSFSKPRGSVADFPTGVSRFAPTARPPRPQPRVRAMG